MGFFSRAALRAVVGFGVVGVLSQPAAAVEAVAGPVTAPHLRVELVAEARSPRPGEDFWVGVLFEPEEHWHIYWKNPGDSGLPPSIRWRLPSGASAGEIRWPAPRRLASPPLMDFGYEGRTLLMVPVRGLGPEPADLAVRVDWLVCRKTCIPGKAELKLRLPAADPRPSEFARARASWPTEDPRFEVKLKDLGPELALEFPKSLSGEAFQSPEFFPAEAGQVDGPAPQLWEETATGARLKLRKSDQLTRSLGRLGGVLVYGPAGARRAVELEAKGEGGLLSGQGWVELVRALFFAFVGGLVLNLMPCVFPVLSIKVLAFMAQKDHKIGLQRRHALVYALGILVSFWALTGVLLGLRAAGEHIGWGFQLQSPPFVAVLACLLFFFGLSLVGVFEIGGAFLGAGQRFVRGEGYPSSFFTGVLATIVATPCTAPLMGSAIGFALAQPVPVVFVTFTALASGLALPYVALSWFPGAGKRLPRPGRWMETFKQLMAFPVFGTVVWLVWIYGLQTDVHGVLRLLSGVLLLALGGWVLGRYPSRTGGLATGAIVALALWVGLSRGSEPGWEPYSAERVAELRSRREPVFVDFTAAWCVSCKVNELVALRSGDVTRALAKKKVHLLKGDWTSRDPRITEALRQFGRSGVPFYVLYYSNGKTEEVVTLPEVLTPQIVVEALEKIPQ